MNSDMSQHDADIRPQREDEPIHMVDLGDGVFIAVAETSAMKAVDAGGAAVSRDRRRTVEG